MLFGFRKLRRSRKINVIVTMMAVVDKFCRWIEVDFDYDSMDGPGLLFVCFYDSYSLFVIFVVVVVFLGKSKD